MGIEPNVLAGNVIGIVAQRLVRALCNACKQPYDPSPVEVQLLKLKSNESAPLYRAVGCRACENRGFKGRLSIMELLKFDAVLDAMVTERASLKAMGDYLQKKGFVTMAEDGMRRVRAGMTTLEEVGRVVDLTEWLD